METHHHVHGPTALKTWLDADGRKQKWLAHRVGVQPSTVSSWLAGHRRPSLPARTVLAAITGLAGLRADEAWPCNGEEDES